MNNLYEIFLLICILYIWFDTDAFFEWSKFLHLRIYKYKEFEDLKKKIPVMTYQNYLLIHHSNFFTRMITCPICFGVWINIIGSLLLNNWASIGVNILATWVGYKFLQGFLTEK